MKSKLLFQGPALVVCPSLAVKIGLNDAMMLQQIHYWLERSTHEIEGRRWVYNTYHDWQKQLAFLSVGTIKVVIRRLEKLGVLLTGVFNRVGIDRTKWYTIDYEKLEQVMTSIGSKGVAAQPQVDEAEGEVTPHMEQADPTGGSPCVDEELDVTRPIPKSTSKIPSKNPSEIKRIYIFTPKYLIDKLRRRVMLRSPVVRCWLKIRMHYMMHVGLFDP